MALEGFRLLDFTRHLPGPFATHLLADMGMDVIKVEEVEPRGGVGRDALTPPSTEDGHERRHAIHNTLARNKRSLAIDLVDQQRRPRAQEVLYRLVRESHVVIEAYRPGVMESMGADYEVLKRHNPSIVYCSMSAFGQDGPYAGRPAHGGQMEAISGVTVIDSTGAPIRFPVPVADTSGAFYAVTTILGALVQFQQTGQGCYLDVSMSAAALSLLVMQTSRLQNPFVQPQAPRAPGAVGFLQCGDGKWLSTGNLETYYWERFCHALDHPEWVALRDGSEAEVAVLATEARRLFATRPRHEWLELLVRHNTCVGAVNSPAEAFEDPQMVHLGMRREKMDPEVGKVAQLGFPVRVDGRDYLGDFQFAPMLGADSREILLDLGYPDIEIATLARDGVISCPSAG
jgi:crotonobetainyl-CoA:carnitine CoA-transferase CaiB-like acyl-CoA transferase